MKYLCPACDRLTEIASFQLEGGALLLSCARCGAQSREEPPPGDLQTRGGVADVPPAPVPPPSSSPSMPAPAAIVPGESAASELRGAEGPARVAPGVPAPPRDPLAGAQQPGRSGAPAPGVLNPQRGALLSGPGTERPSQAEVPAESPGQVVFLRARSPTGAYPASREDPLAVPDGFCPKCISRRRSGGPACASCGLVFSVFDPQEHRPSSSLLAGWTALGQAWEDNTAHDRFLQLAVTEGALAGAGRLYRIQLAHNPDDPYAARGRDEVLRMAAAASALDLRSGEERPALLARRNQKWLVAGMVLFLALVLGVLIRSVTSVGAR